MQSPTQSAKPSTKTCALIFNSMLWLTHCKIVRFEREGVERYFRRRLFYRSWCRGYRRVIFFWHGFPADSGKNEDLAEHLHRQFEVDVYLMHFAGLGRSHGRFTFLGAFEDALFFVKEISARNPYQTLDMVGHSFGALVASHVAQLIGGIDRLILLAPLVAVPSPEVVREVLEQFTAERDDHDLVSLQRETELLGDLRLRVDCCNDLFVLHGRNDSVLDCRTSHTFVQQCGADNVSYRELACDHWFEDRGELCQLVGSFLKGNT